MLGLPHRSASASVGVGLLRRSYSTRVVPWRCHSHGIHQLVHLQPRARTAGCSPSSLHETCRLPRER